MTPTLVWSRTFFPTSRDVVPKDAPVEILPDEIAERVTRARSGYAERVGQERLDHNRWMADRTAEVVAALRAATLNAAEFRGEGGLEGQVRAGGKTDLVLVSDDPLVDIRATRRVRRVWRSGTLVFRR